MSQEQPRRPLSQDSQQESNKYGGDLLGQAVASRDASMMENAMLGEIQKGGMASLMQSAATGNDRAGVVAGVGITEMDPQARRTTTETVGGQVGGRYCQPIPLATFERGNITIGEALEATALTSGHKPVDYSDAAAIQAAEVRATGRTNIVPGGVAAAAQSAATRNARTAKDEDKTKLADILTDATTKLPADKPVTRRDAEGVIGAELRNDPNLTTRPGGVAASVAAAARLNQNK